MKILYLDCSMGAAGDMLAAALLELLPAPDQDAFLETMNSLGLSGVAVRRETSVKCGVHGTHFAVTVNGEEEGEPHGDHDHDNHHHHDHEHDHDHHHAHGHGMAEIGEIVAALPLAEGVRADILAVYRAIAAAESRIHGVPVDNIHFHELGTMDALADITAVSLLMSRIAPQEVVVSPVHVGSGQVRCAHGILPVPAPATALLLKDVPIYGGSIRGELCTPTGAALLTHFATRFGPMPLMRTGAIGYGMGQKDFEAANCVRAMLGETDGPEERICELRCNVDDMTGEEIGFAIERLLECGALDAFAVPVTMKKSRPATLLTVLCREEARASLTAALFRLTTTLGVRETLCARAALQRTQTTLETPCGTVRRKDSEGFGVSRRKYEYDDLARIAREREISLREAAALIEGA
jgi:uncharacterized protein (TIGR00299 family) protein